MAVYKVSALKYRPQKFSEVVSQEFVTKTLRNAKLNNKIAHSYLLSGPRGVGKTTIARIFAKALNCKNSKEGEPCNECESCEEITKGVHPDIFELDAASNRGIDDVRAIQDAAKFFPIKAKYKFFIIDEVHMLTIQAFNALLKILEEPPEYLIFILATTNPEKIPQTIISRCQRYSLHRLKIDDIIHKIKEVIEIEKIKIDEESIFIISKLGEGSLRDSLGIFDMAISYFGNDIDSNSLKELLNLPDKEIYFRMLDFIESNDSKGLIILYNDFINQGFDVVTFYNGLTGHLRNLLIVKSSSDIELLDETDNIKKRFSEQAEKFTEGKILRLLKILFESEARFKYSNNQSILFETILIELCRINKEVVDLASLISGLEEYKKKTPDLKETGIPNDSNVELKPDIIPDNIPVGNIISKKNIIPVTFNNNEVKTDNNNPEIKKLIDLLGLEEYSINDEI